MRPEERDVEGAAPAEVLADLAADDEAERAADGNRQVEKGDHLCRDA